MKNERKKKNERKTSRNSGETIEKQKDSWKERQTRREIDGKRTRQTGSTKDLKDSKEGKNSGSSEWENRDWLKQTRILLADFILSRDIKAFGRGEREKENGKILEMTMKLILILIWNVWGESRRKGNFSL